MDEHLLIKKKSQAGKFALVGNQNAHKIKISLLNQNLFIWAFCRQYLRLFSKKLHGYISANNKDLVRQNTHLQNYAESNNVIHSLHRLYRHQT